MSGSHALSMPYFERAGYVTAAPEARRVRVSD